MNQPKITPWIPLIQTGVKWVVVLVVFLYFKDTFHIINERVLGGSSLKIGAAGLELGVAPVMEDEQEDEIEAAVERFQESPMQSPMQSPVKGMAIETGLVLDDVLEEAFYLVHAAQKKSEGVYEIKMGIGTHYKGAAEKIDRVVYILHESFDQERREVGDPGSKNGFPLVITAWGQFEAEAEIYLKGSPQPIFVSRFLNF